jgi:hypothetical protein
MSVIYNATVKNSRMNVARGATGSGGIDNSASLANLLITTLNAGGTTLVTLPLNKPSFTLTNATLTLVTTTPVSASAGQTGTAAWAQINDGGGTSVITGLTVGTGGQDIVLNSTSITSGQTVTITSGSISHG